METLSCDLETYSSEDLRKCGVYRYCEAPDFEILLFAYSVDGGEVQLADLASGEKLPREIIKAVTDDSVIKWAWHANFERVCLSRYLRDLGLLTGYLNPEGWRCDMVWAATLGLPFSLEGAGAVLGLDKQKLTEGKELIRYFCKPCSPTQANSGRTRNLPCHAPDKWEMFKRYNIRDVETEMGIQQRLSKFPVPDFVWEEYHLDQEINDRGVKIDMELVRQAIAIDERSRNELISAMREFTQLENPNSVQQMKDWLANNGLMTESLDKKAVAELMKNAPPELIRVLTLRQQLAKSSVRKYQAMQNAVCADGRARGLFSFYGANRTGRFSSKIIQLQNLARNSMSDLDQARALIKSGDYDAVSMLYDDVPDTLSQLVRTAFVPPKGKLFYVADFSAIEARVIAWFAGEKWRMELFKNGGDIYCMSASQMFKVPVEKHGVNGHLRQKGKIAELSCIAEGQLVLTDRGLVPIQDVRLDDRLWDGESWVEHDGVVYKGEKEVIEYEGLTATADHLVWIEGESEPVHFGYAATSGAHLVQTGNGWNPIRLGENHISRKTLEQKDESLLRSNSMHRVWCDKMDKSECSDFRKIERLSELFTARSTNSEVAVQEIISGKTKMYQPQKQRIQQLRRAWNQIWIRLCVRGLPVFNRQVWYSIKGFRNRPHRHQRRLRPWEHLFFNPCGKLYQSASECTLRIQTGLLAVQSSGCYQNAEKRAVEGADYRKCKEGGSRKKKEMETHRRTARLYDIRNAGKHHRFTVSGHLVHNCGYGGGIGALKNMGALEMGLKEEELQPLVNAWRNANPNIVKFWWAVDNAVMEAVNKRTTTETHGITFSLKSGMLFITLPSGRKLAYVKPRIGMNQFGGESITYEGIGATKKWERLESYGPKFVENIVQATARDILCYAMKTLRCCSIVMHIHDEVVIEADPRVSLDALCEQMGRTPPWAEGLILTASGYTSPYYKKD